MPKAAQLYNKYLPEVFELDLEHIKELVRDAQISITVDETPEIHGDPAVAVLFTFYKDSENVRYTMMTDLEVLESCNAVSVSALTQQVLDKFEKRWEDVVCFCSDSASYMKKLCEDLKSAKTEFNPFIIRDPCQLLDGVVKRGLKCSKLFQNVLDFVMHSGAVFKYARELKRKYIAVCRKVGVEPQIIPSVTQSRWYSVIEAVNVLIKIWRPFVTFLNSADAKGKKCESLRQFVDTDVKKNTFVS
nr:PREDICTED: uncharacterized protein LOC106703453 [Latimeria chalumnae]|eukprot:XP_014343832.1 PREDICTED: uncharacterized protein LOC106703453 [Latimeria chalumnae]